MQRWKGQLVFRCVSHFCPSSVNTNRLFEAGFVADQPGVLDQPQAVGVLAVFSGLHGDGLVKHMNPSSQRHPRLLSYSGENDLLLRMMPIRVTGAWQSDCPVRGNYASIWRRWK
jgi:hypothetical protein